MAQVFTIKAKGNKQGDFKGSSIRYKDQTECHGFEYKVSAPFDANRGSHSGKRRHEPLSVTAQLDKSSVLYWNALINSETLTNVTLTFYSMASSKTAAGGTGEKAYYTIELTNATVVSHTQKQEQDSTHSEGTDTYEVVMLQFSFQKITVTWLDGGITGVDDWNVAV
jgi:type VI secretion system secreted protein Hcp